MKRVLSRSCLVILLAATGPASIALAEAPPGFLLKWGSLGNGNGQFDHPYGMAIDAAGNIIVADHFNHRVQKFTNDGVYVTQWGSAGGGDGQFQYPNGVGIDAAGNVYVVDQNNHRVQKFDAAGNFLTKWGSFGSGDGQFHYPVRIAADLSGNVYVSDTQNHRVLKFTNTGTYITQWGTSGTGDGEFNGPGGIAIDVAGDLYVVDQNNHRVQKFTNTGTFITQWGEFGTGNGQFNVPLGLSIDSNGSIFVGEALGNRVQKFTSDGVYITQWGSTGTGNGQFDLLVDVQPDAAGNVFVSDHNNPRVQKFGNTGSVPDAANCVIPTSITAGPDGTCCFEVLVRDAANNPIPGSIVTVDFGPCPVTFCPTQPPGITVNLAANTARVATNAAGVAHICLCISSQLSGCSPEISADGVVLGTGLTAMSCPPDSLCVPETWTAVGAAGPHPARHSAAMASNYDYETVTLFGGDGASGLTDQTWKWDGFQWGLLSPVVAPAARAQHAMVYDRARHRMVMFGGQGAAGRLGDTWEFDGTNWTLVASSGPSPREQHAMAYDNTRGRVVLFGGYDGNYLGDTWEWDGSAWVQTATTGPAPRREMAMAFDHLSGLTMLYGGQSGAGDNGEFWLYNGTGWYELPILGSTPGPRSAHGMAFNHEGSSMVLYGGVGAGADASTWRWNGAKWFSTTPGVGLRNSHVMVYDHFNDHMMIQGGLDQPNGQSVIDQTHEWCSPCAEVAVIVDSTGAEQYPIGIDTSAWIESEQEIARENGPVPSLYPEFDTSTDTWYADLPCNPSLGGEVDEEDFADQWPEESDSLDLGDLTEQELSDSLSVWNARIETQMASEPPPFANGLAAAGPYTPPTPPHCPDGRYKYAFGGRDIVFIHGYRVIPIQDKLFGTNDTSLVDWIPTNGAPGEPVNATYYGDANYWKGGATNYWRRHIERFLVARGYKNRYLVVAWSPNQRLDVGAQAILTQISDAMREGRGVVDLSGNNDSTKFGTPSFVVVSHSTGGPITDLTLASAAHMPHLQATHIAARAKAHVALEAVFSGSDLVMPLVALSALVAPEDGGVAPDWLCKLIGYAFWEGAFNCGGWANIGSAAAGVSWDLVPVVMQRKWMPILQTSPTPTVTVTGGHPTFQRPLKRKLLRGLDDGVTTSNSSTANPNQWAHWPSGYILLGYKKFASKAVKDMGINDGSKKARSKGYFRDQIGDADRTITPNVFTEEMKDFLTRVASGATDHTSPTGMLQPSSWTIAGGPLDPKNRVPNHFSFVESASDHFGMTPKFDEQFNANNEYRPTWPGDMPNMEEVRVVTDNGIYLAYGGASDPAPLIDATDATVSQGLTMVETVKEKCYSKRKNKPCKKWRWQRTYHQLAGLWNPPGGNALDWRAKMGMDYAYDYLLTARPDTCTSSTVGIGSAGFGETFYARSDRNPFVGELRIEFRIPQAAEVSLDVLDIQGRRVRELLTHRLEAGVHRISWDRRLDSGGIAHPGVYFWRLRVDGGAQAVRKAMLLE